MNRAIALVFICIITISAASCNQDGQGDVGINKIKIKYSSRNQTSIFALSCQTPENPNVTRFDSVIIDDVNEINKITKCISKSKADSNINGIDTRVKIYLYKDQELKSTYCLDGGTIILLNDEKYFSNLCIADLVYSIIEKRKEGR